MSGYYGRQRYGQRRPSAPKNGRIERANKYAGPCHYCGQTVEAGRGQLFGADGQWSVVHLPHRWHGSPVSGRWVGGCPGEADAMNAPATTETVAGQ